MTIVEAHTMTYLQLENEMDKLYPGLNRGEAARKLAQEMGGYSHRTIAAYLYGSRRIVPTFITRFVEFYVSRKAPEADSLLQRLKAVPANANPAKVVLAESKMLLRMQKSVDAMCNNCAGAKIEDGGFCWDGSCPLAEHTRYPSKPSPQ